MRCGARILKTLIDWRAVKSLYALSQRAEMDTKIIIIKWMIKYIIGKHCYKQQATCDRMKSNEMHNIFWIGFAMISSHFYKAAEYPTSIKSTKFIIMYLYHLYPNLMLAWGVRIQWMISMLLFIFIWRLLVSNIFNIYIF